MKSATSQRSGAGLVAWCLFLSLSGSAGAQGPETGRRPEGAAPRLQGVPDAAPKRPPPQPRRLPENGPSAREGTPGQWQGCPDTKRKLELIV